MDTQKDPIIKVVNADTLDEALKLKRQGLKPIVLDMANREFPGGGTLHICLDHALSFLYFLIFCLQVPVLAPILTRKHLSVSFDFGISND